MSKVYQINQNFRYAVTNWKTLLNDLKILGYEGEKLSDLLDKTMAELGTENTEICIQNIADKVKEGALLPLTN